MTSSDDSVAGMPIPAASAVCQFKMADLTASFNGPFKKRINNAWRPVGFDREKSPISPDPYSVGVMKLPGNKYQL